MFKNKFKVVLFILNPGLFIYHDLNVNFDARFAQIEISGELNQVNSKDEIKETGF